MLLLCAIAAANSCLAEGTAASISAPDSGEDRAPVTRCGCFPMVPLLRRRNNALVPVDAESFTKTVFKQSMQDDEFLVRAPKIRRAHQNFDART